MLENKEILTTITDHNLQEMRQHGTKDFPLGVYRDNLLQFEQGKIPWHWHEEIQFDLVVKGEIYFQIGSRGFWLKEGQAIFINAGVLHQILPREKREGQIAAYVLRDSLLEADVLSAVYQRCLLPIVKGSIDSVVFDRGEDLDNQAAMYLRQIQDVFIKEDTGYQIEIKGLLCCLFSCLLKRAKQGSRSVSARERRDMERIKEAITFIEGHYEESLSLGQIAAQLALSRSELCRCFQRVMDITPYEYLIQHRIKEASKRLRQTDDRILDIALQCGFDSIGHMGRYFRRYCGCSPSAFRKKL